jgi:putative acetyltransferase
MGVIVRSATESDAPGIAAAEWSTAATPGLLVQRPGEIPVAAFATKIAELSRLGSYWVAEETGALVGHAYLEPMRMAGNAHVFILGIVVHPGRTGRGVGTALMEHLLGWARARPELRKVELNVRATNARAVALYEKHGFVEEGRRRGRVMTVDGAFVDDVLMAWFSDGGVSSRG